MTGAPTRQLPGAAAPAIQVRMHDVWTTSRQRVATMLRERTRGHVEASLGDLATQLATIRNEVVAVATSLDTLEDRLRAAADRLHPGPFRAEMTVHAAHARHPGVRPIFAARGLPHCPSCAVGADETLAEAASGEGLDLQELLAALAALES